MRLSDLKSNDDIIAEELDRDPEFAAIWKRTALARAVATTIVRYRGEHQLSQRDLALVVGMTQPQIARIELGETNPSIETLMRLSSKLGIEFTIDVRPAGRPALNVTKSAQTRDLVGPAAGSEAALLVTTLF
jgi:transcriptional regulator with XRE-family HTH domain